MATYSRMRVSDLLTLLQERFSTDELRALLADPDELQAQLAQLEGFCVTNREARLQAWFSKLRAGEYEITSNIDFGYNCIAWSANDMAHFWWPAAHYWPSGILAEASERAFAELYISLGYEECGDGRFQRGFEKVALFAKDGAPTHAARQLPDGRWTSKLGRWEDIAHRLEALTGNEPASRLWGTSFSAVFSSLVIAIEALADKRMGNKARFRQFLEVYAPGAALEERRNRMYALRSEIPHSDLLMEMDQDTHFSWGPPEREEEGLLWELWGLTRIALRNWLRNST